MSDSGEPDESERLSDLDEIAESLRAGELDADTRFGLKRNQEYETNRNGKTPDELLETIRSVPKKDETPVQEQLKLVMNDGKTLTAWAVPDGEFNYVVRISGEKRDPATIATLIAEENFRQTTADPITVKVITEAGQIHEYRVESNAEVDVTSDQETEARSRQSGN